MEEYKEIFMAEANEYLQVLNDCLMKMEDNPGDTGGLQEMFRVVHSLKGMSGTMGYELLTEVSHDLENFMEKLKSGAHPVTADMVDLLFESVDILQGLLIDPESPGEAEKEAAQKFIQKIAGLQSAFKEAPGDDDSGDEVEKETADENMPEDDGGLTVELSEVEKEVVRAACQRGEKTYEVKVDFIEGTLMKSVRSYMIVRALEQFGEIVATEPSIQEMEEERFDLTIKIVLVSSAFSEAGVKENLLKIADVETVEVRERHAGTSVPQSGAGSGDAAQESAPSAKPEPGEEKKDENVKTTSRQADTVKAKDVSSARVTEKTVRVETAKLDELINLIGEMVIMRNSVMEKGVGLLEDLDRSLGQMERVITDLQNVAMKLRMVPIKQVFDRFPRMVRDISRERDKEVQLEINGEETELDRSIVNRLSDPLVHLLRNAIDHGIESVEERVAGGKNKAGNITLKAFHESSHVIITVEDDGGGIDPEILKKKALEKGIVDEEEVARMKDEEALDLIFYSGFSTSAEITEVSGRGVGMDAVKKNIELMRGTIEIKSEVGKGTLFILRFPLTLAIIKALLVRAGGHIFAIPIETIRENVFLEPHQIKTIQKDWVINIRGEVISLYNLGSLLNFHTNDYREMPEYPVVIIEVGNKKAGFIVEELIGQQEIVIKSLGGYLREIRGIAGATVLGDGRVTLIVDVVALLEDRREKVG